MWNGIHPINIVDIPIEKVKEQRERYKQMNINQTKGFMLGIYMGAGLSMLDVMMGETGVVIKESDAGQLAIDERARIERAKCSNERVIQKQKDREEKAKYIGLSRNEICICGSGIKYKKCCLVRIEKI